MIETKPKRSLKVARFSSRKIANINISGSDRITGILIIFIMSFPEENKMTQAKFNEIITKQLAKTTETLTKKGTEYAINEDRLVAFKQAAELQQCSAA